MTVWFTGLSGAGKTTVSNAVAEQLLDAGYAVEVLDGETMRANLGKGLGFSKEDRDENIRRIGYVAHLLSRNGVIVLVAAISPYRAVRDEVRARIGHFVEVYVNAPLAVCERRDVKGLYARARAGEIRGFTGIDDPYEPPLAAELECHTDVESVEVCAARVVEYVKMADMKLMGPSIKLNKDLYERVKKHAEARGYSSLQEFVEHVLERELAQTESGDSDAEIARKLQGLGYLD